MTPTRTESSNFPEIQRLRGIAVFLVMWRHLPFISGNVFPYTGSWAGVDLFFVISGFVVTKSWYESAEKFRGKFWRLIAAFYGRRVFRIVPLAVLWIVVSYLFALHFNLTGNWGTPQDLRNEIKSILTLTYNYKVTASLTSNLGVYWSLIVEEHFYLFLPWFLLVTTSFAKRVAVIVSLVLFTVFVSRTFLIPSSHNWQTLYTLTHLRIDSLLMGVLIFHLYVRYEFASRCTIPKYSGVGLAILGVGILWLQPWFLPMWARTHGLSVNTIASSMLVVLAICSKGYIFGWTIVGRVLEWMGSRSYGLYLGHVWVLALEKEIAFRIGASSNLRYVLETPALRSLFAISIIGIVTEIFYRLVERPFRKQGSILSKRILNQPMSSRHGQSLPTSEERSEPEFKSTSQTPTSSRSDQ